MLLPSLVCGGMRACIFAFAFASLQGYRMGIWGDINYFGGWCEIYRGKGCKLRSEGYIKG